MIEGGKFLKQIIVEFCDISFGFAIFHIEHLFNLFY